MSAPRDIKEIIQRFKDTAEDGARFGCQFKVDYEGLPISSINTQTFSLPGMKGSEASEHIFGVERPLDGVPQFGGEEGFPVKIKVRRKGKTIKEILNLFYSHKRIPKARLELVGPGETAMEGEIFDFYNAKITIDATSLEDDSNTEILMLDGTFKFDFWLPGD